MQRGSKQDGTNARGVFAVARGTLDHPFFKDERFTEREAWLWLIEQAVWQPLRVRVHHKVYDLKRGQLVHAVRFLADRWKWSKSKVERFLDRLKAEGMIETLADRNATIITISKYDDYQFGRETTGTQTGTLAGPLAGQRRRI